MTQHRISLSVHLMTERLLIIDLDILHRLVLNRRAVNIETHKTETS